MDTTGFTVGQLQEIARRLSAMWEEDAELERALGRSGQVTFRSADRLSIDAFVAQKKLERQTRAVIPRGTGECREEDGRLKPLGFMPM